MAVLYQHVKGVTDIRDINKKIRKQIRKTTTRDRLTELLNRSKYLITLTYSPGWKKSFRGKIRKMRSAAKEEYTKTAKTANQRLKKANIKGKKYDTRWG